MPMLLLLGAAALDTPARVRVTVETPTWIVGALVRVTATFTAIDTGLPVDPSTIVATVTGPDDQATVYTHVRASAGVYHVDVNASSEGLWRARFASTGIGQAAGEEWFFVKTQMPV